MSERREGIAAHGASMRPAAKGKRHPRARGGAQTRASVEGASCRRRQPAAPRDLWALNGQTPRFTRCQVPALEFGQQRPVPDGAKEAKSGSPAKAASLDPGSEGTGTGEGRGRATAALQRGTPQAPAQAGRGGQSSVWKMPGFRSRANLPHGTPAPTLAAHGAGHFQSRHHKQTRNF